MKFQVLENGKPCDHTGFPELKKEDWKKSKFESFSEAVDYARKWLYLYANCIEGIQPNNPIDYSGLGDTIEIRTVED